MRTGTLQLKDYYAFLGDDGKNPLLDYYLPSNSNESKKEKLKRPCIIICPGGGYWICSETEGEPVALNLLPMGFNVFVLKYSTRTYKYPNQLIEIAAAFNLIEKKREEWGCDTEKISIIGFSSGGHLAANYATDYDNKYIKERFNNVIKPFSCSLCYPVITADDEYSHKGSFLRLLGENPSEEERISVSCEKLVSKKTPPCFIWHTSRDSVVPVQNSLMFANALAQNGVPFELLIYPMGDHGLSVADESVLDFEDDNSRQIHNWLMQFKVWYKGL